MLKIILILLSLSASAHAQENWRCSNGGSSIEGNKFYACGIGNMATEGVAREYAMRRAIYEFEQLCLLSTGCAGKPHHADPGRTVCEQIAVNNWKCTRLLIFTID